MEPNKVLKEAGLTEALRLVKTELDKKIEDADLAPVALSNSYTDLDNKPTIPVKTSDITNDGSDGTSTYVQASQLALVATTNDYEDLDNKPQEITTQDVDNIWASLFPSS